MFDSVVIVLKCRLRIIRWINKHTLHLPRVFLLQRFEREQIVPEDQLVIEEVIRPDPIRGMVGLLRIFEQDARLQLGPVLLPDPGEFEFLFLGWHL